MQIERKEQEIAPAECVGGGKAVPFPLGVGSGDVPLSNEYFLGDSEVKNAGFYAFYCLKL